MPKIYKMKAETGYIGVKGSNTGAQKNYGYDWGVIITRIAIAVIVVAIAGFWLYKSNEADNVRNAVFDKCVTAYQDNALQVGAYQAYMENCEK